ncbi:MAG TPA: DUF6064 family protein [Bacteroidales bacterium]|nr:DUF6064 family protein [Bacteroidales bacterium]
MKPPFSTEQFLSVFEKYNTVVFPAQIILLLAAVSALALVHAHIKNKNRFISSVLSLLWLWNGIVYQMIFFSDINKAALIFGIILSFEAALILYEGLLTGRLTFSFSFKLKDLTGYFLIIYGLFLYPLIHLLSGHNFHTTISLGLPCPTTILTLGFFLLSSGKFPRYLLIIPSLWAVIGMSAAINFGIYQDFVMPLAALISFVVLTFFNRMHNRKYVAEKN